MRAASVEENRRSVFDEVGGNKPDEIAWSWSRSTVAWSPIIAAGEIVGGDGDDLIPGCWFILSGLVCRYLTKLANKLQLSRILADSQVRGEPERADRKACLWIAAA
ncbi:hypothetical protein GCM10008965_34830 [Methylorubrum aminovorans]|nr:hypothetical protein GCM10025880_63430 [Methylorubrum aminovorans]